MTKAYYARCKKCRGVIMATVSDPAIPDTLKHSARDVAEAVRAGETVAVASVEKVRAMRWCECYRKSGAA